MSIPLIFSFWFMVAAYVINVLDESLLGGSFVEKVQLHWWPQYSWTKFFWFNAGHFAVMIGSVVLYDQRDGEWVQHSYLDGLLLHRAVPAQSGNPSRPGHCGSRRSSD